MQRIIPRTTFTHKAHKFNLPVKNVREHDTSVFVEKGPLLPAGDILRVQQIVRFCSEKKDMFSQLMCGGNGTNRGK